MGMKIQTIKETRLQIQQELRELYPLPEISAITNIIFKTIDESIKLHHIYDPETILSENAFERISLIINELKKGRPIQYVIGHTYFLDFRIIVNETTLIPRPETEELVDLVIRENKNFTGNIIDIGTGSGCIAIALARMLRSASVCATDISAEALKISEQNALNNNVKIRFLNDDILNPLNIKDIMPEIIVSNPPYVRNSEKVFMHRNVLENEPGSALFVDDEDPLIFYKAILRWAQKNHSKGGKIYFEINEALGNEMKELLKSFGYSDIHIIKDLNGKDRIAKGIK